MKAMIFAIAIVVSLTGCAGMSPPPLGVVQQDVQERAAFEMGCEQTQAKVLYEGEFSLATMWYVGASGCGQRSVYAVECSGELCLYRRWVRTPIDKVETAAASE